MGKKRRKKDEALRRELAAYKKQGVTLWLDGKPSTPGKIVKAHVVAEDGVYMRDYVQNDRGEVEKLTFDFVKEH